MFTDINLRSLFILQKYFRKILDKNIDKRRRKH